MRHLMVHDIATRLPERFSRNDLSWLVPLKLEQDPAFEHVPENRSGMAMRRQPGVCGWKFDEVCHRMCALGNRGRGDAQQIGELDVSCNQHVFDANPDLALAVGPLLHREQGPVQRELRPDGSTFGQRGEHHLTVGVRRRGGPATAPHCWSRGRWSARSSARSKPVSERLCVIP